MNPVVFKDVPGANQDNVVVANEGVVRHSELPGQDALECFDCRMGNEIVRLTCHHRVVVANALDIDADVFARHWVVLQNTSGWRHYRHLSGSCCCCVPTRLPRSWVIPTRMQ